jgi:hypothetical protein
MYALIGRLLAIRSRKDPPIHHHSIIHRHGNFGPFAWNSGMRLDCPESFARGAAWKTAWNCSLEFEGSDSWNWWRNADGAPGPRKRCVSKETRSVKTVVSVVYFTPVRGHRKFVLNYRQLEQTNEYVTETCQLSVTLSTTSRIILRPCSGIPLSEEGKAGKRLVSTRRISKRNFQYYSDPM